MTNDLNTSQSTPGGLQPPRTVYGMAAGFGVVVGTLALAGWLPQWAWLIDRLLAAVIVGVFAYGLVLELTFVFARTVLAVRRWRRRRHPAPVTEPAQN